MDKPFILYDNVLSGGTLTCPTTYSGSQYNLVDSREYTNWTGDASLSHYITLAAGAAKTVDTVYIGGHNLKTANITFIRTESSTDGVNWTTRDTTVPSDDNPIVKTFASVSAQYWRLYIFSVAGTYPRISIALLGVRTQFPNFIQAPWTPYEETIKADGYESEAGNLLGTSISYYPWKTTIKFKYMATSWITGAYKTFWNTHAKMFKPFVWVPSLDTFPTMIFWARVQKGEKFAYTLKNDNAMVDSFDIMLEGVNNVV